MLNQLVRYAPVLRMLRDEPGSILEIGSGVDGISQFLKRPVVGLEIRYYTSPGRWLLATGGTATDLPFADRSIDVVLVMDTLEHIPAALRARCLSEAMRVARRRIVIGGPMGPRARATDERLAAFYRRRGIEVPDWLQEHLNERAPDVEDVAGALRLGGWSVRAGGNENGLLHVGLMKLESRPIWFRILGRIRRHASKPAAAVARALRLPPYYSWLVVAERRDSASRTAS